MALLIGLALASAALLVVLRASARAPSLTAGMRVVGRLALEPRRSIYVVDVGGRCLVVGVGEGPMALLAELDAPPAGLAATGLAGGTAAESAGLAATVARPAGLAVTTAQPAGLAATVAQPAGLAATVARPAGLAATVAQPAQLAATTAQPAGLAATVAEPAVARMWRRLVGGRA